MDHYLLYVAATSQIESAVKTFEKLKSIKSNARKSLGESYRVEHRMLQGHVLHVFIISDIEQITSHLRQLPIDLLIYDERGKDSEDSVSALGRIQDDMKQFAELWGPDFHFPMSRVVCILKDIEKNSLKPFHLGRFQVRNVCINPRRTEEILLWLKDVLTQGPISDNNKVGVALSGGGIEGFLYQIGCLHALDLALENKSLHQCNTFSGVSSGSICAALLATKVPPREAIRALKKKSEILPDFAPSMFYDLAMKKILERVAKEALRWEGLSPKAWGKKLLRLIPTGFFKGENASAYFEQAILSFGGVTRIDELENDLFIGTTDQDSFESVVFGSRGWRDIKIIDAVRASCALPPFFTPVQIKDRHFIDGQITGSCNLTQVVKSGCRLVILIDPLRPYTAPIPGTIDQYGGVFSIIQIIKALVYSRFRQTLEHVTERYPDVDFIVFQPDEDCAELMAGSPMRYSLRTQIIDLAISGTLRRLRNRNAVYAAKFAKYGFHLKKPSEIRKLEEGDFNL